MKKLLIAVFAAFSFRHDHWGKPSFPLTSWMLASMALMFPALAFAQTVTPAPSSGPAWLGPVLQYIVVPLIPITGSLIVWALTELAKFLRAKGSNSKVAGAFAIAVDFFETAFVHLRAGIEGDIKDALADGTIDSTERANLVKKLVELAKAELPDGIKTILGGALGPALETWLAGKAGQVVQAAVAQGVTQTLAVAATPLVAVTAPAPSGP